MLSKRGLTAWYLGLRPGINQLASPYNGEKGPVLVSPWAVAPLAAALVTHSYAFLLFVPLVAGELARSILEKRKDWIVWFALIGSGPAILVSLPLLLTIRTSPRR